MSNENKLPLRKRWWMWAVAILIAGGLGYTGYDKLAVAPTVPVATESHVNNSGSPKAEEPKSETASAPSTAPEAPKEEPKPISDVDSLKIYLKEHYGTQGAKAAWYDNMKDIEIPGPSASRINVKTDLSGDAASGKKAKNIADAILGWGNQANSNVKIVHVYIYNSRGAIIELVKNPKS